MNSKPITLSGDLAQVMKYRQIRDSPYPDRNAFSLGQANIIACFWLHGRQDHLLRSGYVNEDRVNRLYWFPWYESGR